MNKRHYEHTLPNIRGSLSNTYNKWDWKDILADLAGIVAGYLTHVCTVWTIM